MRLPIICASLLLAACQSHYVPAEGDNTATVTFSSDNIAVQPMICVPGQGFVATEFMVSQQPFSSEAITDINEVLKKQPEVAAEIQAGAPAKIGFSYRSKAGSAGLRDRCTIAVMFNAEPGMQYAARFIMVEQQCGLKLTAGDAAVADAVVVPWSCN